MVIMKIYTVIRTSRQGIATILYCGDNKEIADEEHYMDKADEPAPDKNDAMKWVTLEAEFPDWD